MPLTETTIKNAKPKEKRYSLSDSNGLYLEIMSGGSKYWRFRYSFRNKPKLLTFGEYPLVSLKEAREMRDKARTKRTKGENPATDDKKAMTLGDVFEDYRKHRPGKPLSEAYLLRLISRVKKFIYPSHKDIAIKDITAQDILPILRALEAEGKLEMASRIKQIYGRLFRHAQILGQCQSNPTLALAGALQTKKVIHFAAIQTPEEAGALMRAISSCSAPLVKNALLFHAYTFVRPGELRHAEWSEIDFDKALWKIPSEKMKMRRLHVVPLSKQAIAVLVHMKIFSGGGRYIFQNARVRNGSQPMSENAEVAGLRRLGYTKEEMCAHGFRGMASTLLNENGWSGKIIEKQLSHEIKSDSERAYNHAQYLDKRAEMMQWWADYLDGLRDGKAKENS